MLIKNGTFTGKRDSSNTAIYCGDRFITLYDNTQWTVEFSEIKCGFTAKSGTTVENLSRFKSNQIKKIKA